MIEGGFLKFRQMLQFQAYEIFMEIIIIFYGVMVFVC